MSIPQILKLTGEIINRSGMKKAEKGEENDEYHYEMNNKMNINLINSLKHTIINYFIILLLFHLHKLMTLCLPQTHSLTFYLQNLLHEL